MPKLTIDTTNGSRVLLEFIDSLGELQTLEREVETKTQVESIAPFVSELLQIIESEHSSDADKSHFRQNEQNENNEFEIAVTAENDSYIALRSGMAFALGLRRGLESKGYEVKLTKLNQEGTVLSDNQQFQPVYHRPPSAIPGKLDAVAVLPSVEVRPATFEDLGDIAKIEEELFSREKWSIESIEVALKRADYQFFCLTVDYEVAGTLYLNLPHFKDDTVEVMSVGVLKKFQAHGFGLKLLRAALKWLEDEHYQKVHLHVRESNLKAIKLYQKCGFEKINSINHFYQDPDENATVMQRLIGH